MQTNSHRVLPLLFFSPNCFHPLFLTTLCPITKEDEASFDLSSLPFSFSYFVLHKQFRINAVGHFMQRQVRGAAGRSGGVSVTYIDKAVEALLF